MYNPLRVLGRFSAPLRVRLIFHILYGPRARALVGCVASLWLYAFESLGFASQLGEHDMAMNHWRSALKFDPEHVEVKTLYRQLKALEKHNARGDAALAEGRSEDAVEHWKAAVAADASHKAFIGPACLKMAKALSGLKKWADAADACHEALNQHAGADATFEAELALGEVWGPARAVLRGRLLRGQTASFDSTRAARRLVFHPQLRGRC
jgi:tetratricopeptide (TPR) repeat protein